MGTVEPIRPNPTKVDTFKFMPKQPMGKAYAKSQHDYSFHSLLKKEIGFNDYLIELKDSYSIKKADAQRFHMLLKKNTQSDSMAYETNERQLKHLKKKAGFRFMRI